MWQGYSELTNLAAMAFPEDSQMGRWVDEQQAMSTTALMSGTRQSIVHAMTAVAVFFTEAGCEEIDNLDNLKLSIGKAIEDASGLDYDDLVADKAAEACGALCTEYISQYKGDLAPWIVTTIDGLAPSPPAPEFSRRLMMV